MTLIGRRPTLKLGLHPQYPPARTRHDVDPTDTVVGHHHGQRAAIRQRLFWQYSLLTSRIPLPPFPMCTGFPRLEVLRRLRPVPDRSADSEPSPTPRRVARTRARTETVPVFTR